jgi:hypothetical protein
MPANWRHQVPSASDRQRRLAGADLGRLRAGKRPVTGMTAAQLKDFARKPSIKKKGSARK